MLRSSLLIIGLTIFALLLPGMTCFGRNTVIIAVSTEPPSLDPTTNAAAAIDLILNQNVFEGLVRVTAEGEIKPALAASFDVSEDGLTYTFFLRRGVLFHNREQFGASDVVATFTRNLDVATGHPNRKFYVNIEEITAPDPYTVVFHMARVDAAFLSILALGDSIILPEQVPANLAHHPVGTGPFQFAEWRVGEYIRLERFAGYHREGLPLLDEVTFRFISDAASKLLALLAGDVDMVARVPAETALAVQGDPRFNIVVGPMNLVQIMAINNERQPFSNLLVRQAIAHAIDRTAIIEGTMFGMGVPIGSHLTPASPYHIDLTELHPHDPQRARDLLAQAGYPAGFSAVITLPQVFEIHVRTGEIIAEQLSRVGIELEIELVEWGVWLSRVFAQADYDLTVIGHPGRLDPGAMMLHYGAGSEGFYFRRGWENLHLNDLLAEGRTTFDRSRRREIYAEVQTIIAAEAVNFFIQDPYQIFIMNENLAGLRLYPIYLINVTTLFWSP